MATSSPSVDLSKFGIPVTGCGRVTIAASADVVDYEFLGSVSQEQCVFCHSSSAKLKVMRCFHLACVTCASDHLRYDNTLRCCRCQMYTLDPGPGRKLLESLVDWVPLAKGRQLTEASSECASDEVQSGQDDDVIELEECAAGCENVSEICDEKMGNDIADDDADSFSSESDEEVMGTAASETSCLDLQHCQLEGTSASSSDDESDEEREDESDEEISVCGSSCTGSLCEDPVCKGNNEPAISYCLDCEINMCEEHALVHGRLRATRSHKQQPSPMLSSKDREDYCLLHPLKQVRRYCLSCRVPLCTLCGREGQHEPHSTTSITYAGRTAALQCSKVLKESNVRDNIPEAVEDIEKQIQQINQAAEEVSKSITDDFAVFADRLERRRQELYDEVDKKRWNQIAQLETRKNALNEISRQRQVAKHLLNHLSNVDVMTLTTPVEQHCMKQRMPMTSHVKLDTSFKKFGATADVSNHGFLADTMTALTVSERVPGMLVPYCDLFDPASAAKGVTLSSGNKRASRGPATGDSSKYLSVCGLGTYSRGRVSFRVKYGRGHIFLGFMIASSPHSDSEHWIHKRGDFLGWTSQEGSQEFTVGKKLGQPWQKGDIITLTLDMENLKIEACHSRPSRRHPATDTPLPVEIDVPPGNYRFRAELLHNSASVELLPC